MNIFHHQTVSLLRLVVSAVAAAAIGLPSVTLAATLDFDALAAGTPVTTVDGVGLSLDPSFPLVVSSGFDTSSPPNYLGVDDGGSESFLPGDRLTLSFATPITMLSLNVISVAGTPSGAFTLAAAGQTAVSSTPDLVFKFGDELFTLGIASVLPFSSATLTASAGLFSFNVDDINYAPVPLPPMLLPLLGAVGWLGRHRRQTGSRAQVTLGVRRKNGCAAR